MGEGCLCCSVREKRPPGEPSHGRGHVDDRLAALALEQRGYGGQYESVCRGDVEGKRLVEGGRGGVHERGGHRAAHVVHDDVEASEMF